MSDFDMIEMTRDEWDQAISEAVTQAIASQAQPATPDWRTTKSTAERQRLFDAALNAAASPAAVEALIAAWNELSAVPDDTDARKVTIDGEEVALVGETFTVDEKTGKRVYAIDLDELSKPSPTENAGAVPQSDGERLAQEALRARIAANAAEAKSNEQAYWESGPGRQLRESFEARQAADGVRP